jgi:hypothetical protein
MSPAGSVNPRALFSWLGIIMYLPLDDQKQREAIGKAFKVAFVSVQIHMMQPRWLRFSVLIFAFFPLLNFVLCLLCRTLRF